MEGWAILLQPRLHHSGAKMLIDPKESNDDIVGLNYCRCQSRASIRPEFGSEMWGHGDLMEESTVVHASAAQQS